MNDSYLNFTGMKGICICPLSPVIFMVLWFPVCLILLWLWTRILHWHGNNHTEYHSLWPLVGCSGCEGKRVVGGLYGQVKWFGFPLPYHTSLSTHAPIMTICGGLTRFWLGASGPQ